MSKSSHSADNNPMPDELAAAQRNLQPHDILRNDRGVDDLLWHGSTRPSGVQKAGFIIWGTFFVIGGISVASTIRASDRSSYIAIVPALLALFAGTKIFSNALRRRTK